MQPEEAMQKAINRREFITGTTAGVLGALALGPVAAAQEKQPEAKAQPAAAAAVAATAGRVFYSGLSGETMQMRGHHGDKIDAYLARPAGSGRHPGVVVVHHMPGWDEDTIEATRKFAQHGYVSLCPNLHYRYGKSTPEGNSVAMRAAGGLPDAQAMGDIEGAIRHLRSMHTLNGKVGIIGYCSGGRHVYLAACTLKGIDATVACYPNGVGAGHATLTAAAPVDPLDLTKDLGSPLLGLFGKEDKRPSPEHVAKIEAELTRLGKVHELYSYENAGHAFFGTDRPDYRQPAAQDGWKRVLAWFDKYLA